MISGEKVSFSFNLASDLGTSGVLESWDLGRHWRKRSEVIPARLCEIRLIKK
jgi:hypothetical protein